MCFHKEKIGSFSVFQWESVFHHAFSQWAGLLYRKWMEKSCFITQIFYWFAVGKVCVSSSEFLSWKYIFYVYTIYVLTIILRLKKHMNLSNLLFSCYIDKFKNETRKKHTKEKKLYISCEKYKFLTFKYIRKSKSVLMKLLSV